MLTDDPTTRELDRRLDRIEQAVKEGIAMLRDEMRNLLRADTFEAHRQHMTQRIADVEADVTRVDTARVKDRDTLQREITQVEQNRAADRRNMTKAGVGLLAAIVGAVLSVLLPLMLTGLGNLG